ncbi:MAG: M23 family metallopeptidase [Nitrospinota bacterium]|nr:M23 family metallopeptidase [Nitrospinota bacterium]
MIINNLPRNSHNNDNKVNGFKRILGILFVASLLLNIYFVFFQEDPEKPPAILAATKPESQPAEEEVGTVPLTLLTKPASLEQKKLPNIKHVSFDVPDHFDGRRVRSIHFTIRKSLNHTLCGILSRTEGCEILSAYMSRLLVWFIDINKQMRNGDSVNLVYEESDGENRFHILKLKYYSRLLDKMFEANYYKYPGPRYGAFFDPDGKAIAPRIVNQEAPIRDYLEITSLPGDYRKGRFHGHSGTDFKAPTGTPVYSGFDGRVTRRNWNIRANGYSLEIDHPDKKVKSRYLHLSKTLVKVGQFVKQGQKIAKSGNSGRSFAPHLHYELLTRDSKPTVKNPFKSKAHNTYYNQVPAQRKEEFMKMVSLYDSALPNS